MTTRALTSGEKTLLRAGEQKSELFLGILTPEVVFAAQVNQSFTTHDEIAQITFDSVTTGAYTDIISGMTLYIGSAAGLFDLGMVRIRKAATSAIIYIGESSDVDWADDLYLTVVDEMQIWSKHLRIVNEITLIDYDIEYSDQHEDLDPVPVLGSVISTLWLVSGTVDYEPDATPSWVLGSSISTYAWETTGGSVVNETTVTPTFTFTVAGQYRISCTVTAANGKSTIGHRYILVYDDNNLPITNFTMQSCVGVREGWSFSITLFDEATTIRKNSLCVLFSRDYYGDTQQSIAAQSGNENILAVGWLDEETINWNPEQGNINFKCRSANYWLNQLPSFPTGFLNSTITPTTWIEFEDLTVDKATWHLLHWRSTVTAMMDVLLTDDTRLASALESSTGSAWDQLKSLSFEAILSVPKIDRYGALHLAIDSQHLAEADRSAIPVVLDIETQDWRNTVSIPRITSSRVSRVELSGINFDGDDAIPYFSRASGNIFKQHGSINSQDRLLLDDQAQANLLSALILNNDNNEFPKVRIAMSSNFKMSDIAPLQYNTLTIIASDTERGIIWSAKKIIPRRITHSFDVDSGLLLTDIEHEAETLEGLSVTYERPQTPIDNFPPIPDLPTFVIQPINIDFAMPTWNPIAPDLPDTCLTSAPANGGFDLHITGIQKSNESTAFSGIFGSVLRSSSHTNKSYAIIRGLWKVWNGSTGEYDLDPADDTWYNVYGFEADNTEHIATKVAISDPEERRFEWNSLGSSVKIIGIKIKLTLDAGQGWDLPAMTSSAEYFDSPDWKPATITKSTNLAFENNVLGELEVTFPGADSFFEFTMINYFAVVPPGLTDGYFDIYYQLDVPVDDLVPISQSIRIEAEGIGGNHEDFSLAPGGDIEGEYSGTLQSVLLAAVDFSGIDVKFSSRFAAAGTYNTKMLFTIKPVAEHILDYSWVKLYNICDKDTA